MSDEREKWERCGKLIGLASPKTFIPHLTRDRILALADREQRAVALIRERIELHAPDADHWHDRLAANTRSMRALLAELDAKEKP